MSTRYQPRAFTALAAWEHGGLVLKPYLITAAGRTPDPAAYLAHRLPDGMY